MLLQIFIALRDFWTERPRKQWVWLGRWARAGLLSSPPTWENRLVSFLPLFFPSQKHHRMQETLGFTTGFHVIPQANIVNPIFSIVQLGIIHLFYRNALGTFCAYSGISTNANKTRLFVSAVHATGKPDCCSLSSFLSVPRKRTLSNLFRWRAIFKHRVSFFTLKMSW